MTNRAVMQQALECIERCNAHGWILADYEDEVYASIDALKAALAQPEPVQKPMHPEIKKLYEDYFDKCFKETVDLALGTTPPAAQPEQEPVAFYHPHKGFYWAKPTHIAAPTVVDVPPMPLYAAPPAAQPPPEWVGLTEEELRFYRKKYSKLFNAGYDKVTETNLIAEEFNSMGFYKEVSAALKERNT